MSIAELVLLIIAIGAADCAYIFYRYMRKYKGVVDDQGRTIQRLRDANNNCDAYYFIQRIYHPTDDEFEYNGKLAVGRRSITNSGICSSVIKVFADEDEEYNQRCAEELLEKLRE